MKSRIRAVAILALRCAVAVAMLFPLFTITRAEAAYPGANGRIAFFSASPDGAGIFTINPDGTDPQQLTSGGRFPFWSPDGTKIAYTDGQDLMVVGVNTEGTADGEPVNLTNVSNASVLRQYASWSPDGTRLVYERLDKNGFNIWVGTPDLEAGTLDEVQLTTNRADDRVPVWSPSGDEIAFSSTRGGKDLEIYTMSAEFGESSGVTALTSNSVDDSGPDWSPDGTQILYTKTSGKGRAVSTDIYRVASDGSGVEVQLTTSTESDREADWSSDGLSIAFVRGDGDDAEIYTMGTAGESSGITLLMAPNTTREASPDWQRLMETSDEPPAEEPIVEEACTPDLELAGLCCTIEDPDTGHCEST